jgi:hypothetical protein
MPLIRSLGPDNAVGAPGGAGRHREIPKHPTWKMNCSDDNCTTNAKRALSHVEDFAAMPAGARPLRTQSLDPLCRSGECGLDGKESERGRDKEALHRFPYFSFARGS